MVIREARFDTDACAPPDAHKREVGDHVHRQQEGQWPEDSYGSLHTGFTQRRAQPRRATGARLEQRRAPALADAIGWASLNLPYRSLFRIKRLLLYFRNFALLDGQVRLLCVNVARFAFHEANLFATRNNDSAREP